MNNRLSDGVTSMVNISLTLTMRLHAMHGIRNHHAETRSFLSYCTGEIHMARQDSMHMNRGSSFHRRS